MKELEQKQSFFFTRKYQDPGKWVFFPPRNTTSIITNYFQTFSDVQTLKIPLSDSAGQCFQKISSAFSPGQSTCLPHSVIVDKWFSFPIRQLNRLACD